MCPFILQNGMYDHSACFLQNGCVRSFSIHPGYRDISTILQNGRFELLYHSAEGGC